MSDHKEPTPESTEYLMFGGQAIVEGVMMRSPRYFSVACRAPNNAIVIRTEPLEKTWIGRQKWLKLPFLRGTFAILDSMTLGTRAMRFAGDVQVKSEFQPIETDPEKAVAKPVLTEKEIKRQDSLQSVGVGAALVFGLVFGIALFNVLPNYVAEYAGNLFNDKGGTLKNYIGEIVKVILFFGYLWLISRYEPIREVFRYHGAEHKAINVWEAGQPLSMENCLGQTRLHPRCGTSFAVIVFIVSFLLFPIVPRYPITGVAGNPLKDVPVRILVELCLLPLVAGISYELLRLAGKLRDQRWVTFAFAPGLASQKFLTTLEPENKHVEVALASLDAVVLAERTGELTESDDYTLPETLSAPTPATA